MIFAKLEIEPQMEICVKKIMDGFCLPSLFLFVGVLAKKSSAILSDRTSITLLGFLGTRSRRTFQIPWGEISERPRFLA